jgi:hypothetical protein
LIVHTFTSSCHGTDATEIVDEATGWRMVNIDPRSIIIQAQGWVAIYSTSDGLWDCVSDPLGEGGVKGEISLELLLTSY